MRALSSFGFASLIFGVVVQTNAPALAIQARVTASTTISISPSSAPPLTNVEVKGSGFDPYAAADVFFDTADLALAVSDGVGNIDIKFQIPGTAQPGIHYVTADERDANRAAQTQYSVSTSWPMWGFAPTASGYNPYENTIDPSNVAGLNLKWAVFYSSYGDRAPFVLKDGYAYVGDSTGRVHAYNALGQLQWQASPGGNFEYGTAVAYGNNVFFGDASGNVYAYAIGCQHNGGTCTPVWTHSVGTSVGGLTLYNATLYATSSDGKIHPFNPATGAPGTPFVTGVLAIGALTSPVAFYGDGILFVRSYDSNSGNYYLQYSYPWGTTGYRGPFTVPISAPAILEETAYFTSGDGYLQALGPPHTWSAALAGGGTNCFAAPAVANNTVYAGGCTTIGAYDPATGALRWSTSSLGAVSAVSVADGVVYTCESGVLAAYAAAYGGRLWSGGICNSTPQIVNGIVYTTEAELDAYSLPGFPKKPPHRPDPLKLKRNFSLKPQAPIGRETAKRTPN